MHKIELSDAHLRVVLQALGELPLKITMDTFIEIRKQLGAENENKSVCVHKE